MENYYEIKTTGSCNRPLVLLLDYYYLFESGFNWKTYSQYMDPYNEIRPTLVLIDHSCRNGEETLPILQLDSGKSVIYCRYDTEGPTSERELQYAPKNSYLKWNQTTIFL